MQVKGLNLSSINKEVNKTRLDLGSNFQKLQTKGGNCSLLSVKPGMNWEGWLLLLKALHSISEIKKQRLYSNGEQLRACDAQIKNTYPVT